MQDPNLPSNASPYSSAMQPNHHRRAHSEVNFRLSEDLDLAFDGSAESFDEMRSEDDIFSTYMDIEKLRGSGISDSFYDNVGGSGSLANKNCGDGANDDVGRSKHRHSNSVDSSSLMFNENGIEAKKAMAPDKLAELWTIDPKRAKRILANRQSAARSKERKVRYMSELERKVQTLQTEATTLSAQLTLFQRDTTGLCNENTELKLRLQSMEHQAQQRDALNEALKQEVERLRIATGEIMTNVTDTFGLSMQQHAPYNQSGIYSPEPSCNASLHHHHHIPTKIQNSLMQRHQQQQQHDPLGRFQGLNISTREVKPEGPTVSATSESSSTF